MNKRFKDCSISITLNFFKWYAAGDRSAGRGLHDPHPPVRLLRGPGFQMKRTPSDFIDSGVSVTSEAAHSAVRPPGMDTSRYVLPLINYIRMMC